MKGTSKTREKLGVVEELFTYWVLEDADTELEELEDALIVSFNENITLTDDSNKQICR